MSHIGKKGLNKKYLNESISNGAKYVTLDSKIKYPSLTFCFFGNPTNKIETDIYAGTTNSKPLDKSKILSCRSNLLHFFLEVHNCVAHFTSFRKLHEFGAKKPIS